MQGTAEDQGARLVRRVIFVTREIVTGENRACVSTAGYALVDKTCDVVGVRQWVRGVIETESAGGKNG